MHRLILLIVLAVSVFGAKYYVSSTGSDGNNGTSTSTPFLHSPMDVNATSVAASTMLGKTDTVIHRGSESQTAAIHKTDTGIVMISGDRYTPQWGTSPCTLNTGVSYYRTINVQDTSVRFVINGFVVSNTSSPSLAGIQLTGDSSVIINCHVRDVNAAGIVLAGSIGARIINTQVTDCKYGIYVTYIGGGTYIYNCSVGGCSDTGIACLDYATANNIKNCYSGGNGTDYATRNGGTMNLTTCYSEDGTMSTSTTAYATSSGGYFTNVTSGTEDLHIGSSSDLIGAGTDLSGDAQYPVTVDYNGDSRGNPPDVGFDEYVGACTPGTVSKKIVDACTTRTLYKWGHVTSGTVDSVRLKSIDGRSIVAGDSLTMLAGKDTIRWVPQFRKTTPVTITFTVHDCDGESSVDVNDTVTVVVWDDVQVDSVTYLGYRTDSLYYDRTYRLHGYWKGARSLSEMYFGDSSVIKTDSSDTIIDFQVRSGTPIRNYLVVVSDSVASDTMLDVNATDYDSLEVLGDPPVEYTITANQTSYGTISLDPAGGSYPTGTTVTIEAVAGLGNHFVRWLDDVADSTANPISFVVGTENITVSATFTEVIQDTVRIPLEYKSLASAVTNEVQGLNFVTLDINRTILYDTAYNDSKDTVISFTGDATHGLYITVAPASRHSGVYSASKARLVVSNKSILTISKPWVYIDGMQFSSPAVLGSNAQLYYTGINAEGNFTASNCIFKGPGNVGVEYTEAIQNYSNTSAYKLRVINCLFTDWTNTGSDAGTIVNYSSVCSLFIYNSVFPHLSRAIFRPAAMGGPIVAQNNIFYSNTIDITASQLDSNNSTSNTAGTGGLTQTTRGNYFSQSFDFEDSVNYDYRITTDDAGAQGKGLNLTPTFTYDILGATRPSSGAWDIGFNEIAGCDSAKTTAYAAACTTGVPFSKARSFTFTPDSVKHKTLPSGLTENKTNGTVAGTPTVVDTTNDSLFVYTCNNIIKYVDTFRVIDTTGEGCDEPTVSYGTIACSVGVALLIDPSLGGTSDSLTISPSLPAPFTFAKTGANKGRISGTSTIIRPSVNYKVKIWGCENDSTYVNLGCALNPCIPPSVETLTPTAGHRVWHKLPEYSGSDSIRNMVYLPIDYNGVTKMPMIIEFPGNTANAGECATAAYAPIMGYGMSRGSGYIWVGVPFLNTAGSDICANFWEGCSGTGYPDQTVAYVKKVISYMTANFAVDTFRITACGFSRGGVGASLVVLADDTISKKFNGLHMSGFLDNGDYGGTTTDRFNRITFPIMTTIGATDDFGYTRTACNSQLTAAGITPSTFTVADYGHDIRWITDCENSRSDEARDWLLHLPEKDNNSFFTVIVIPDMHIETALNYQYAKYQMQWIASNRHALNIKCVIGVGDLVTNAGTRQEWRWADSSYDILDSVAIPYAITTGNHDYNSLGTRTIDSMALWFPKTRFTSNAWWTGKFCDSSKICESGVNTFLHNNNTYGVMTIEAFPRDTITAWAKEYLDTNHNYYNILSTHSYLDSNNTLTSADVVALTGEDMGDSLWKKLRTTDINFIVSGDIGGKLNSSGFRVNYTKQKTYCNQFNNDYQLEGASNGGKGYLRIYKFKPDSNRIEVRTYSPYLDLYSKTDYRDNFATYMFTPDSVGKLPNKYIKHALLPTAAKLGYNPDSTTGNFTIDNTAGNKYLIYRGPRNDTDIAVTGANLTYASGRLKFNNSSTYITSPTYRLRFGRHDSLNISHLVVAQVKWTAAKDLFGDQGTGGFGGLQFYQSITPKRFRVLMQPTATTGGYAISKSVSPGATDTVQLGYEIDGGAPHVYYNGALHDSLTKNITHDTTVASALYGFCDIAYFDTAIIAAVLFDTSIEASGFSGIYSSGGSFGGLKLFDNNFLVDSTFYKVDDWEIDSIANIVNFAPNPNYTNDSSSCYGTGFTASGAMRNIELNESIIPYYWSSTQIDFKTGAAWPRATYRIEVTNSFGIKDTSRLRIVQPRSK